MNYGFAGSVDGFIIPDLVLPGQIDTPSVHPQTRAIHNLMLAVLVDGINALKSKDRRYSAEARQWFESTGENIFDYRFICEVLCVDAGRLWERLREGAVILKRRSPIINKTRITEGTRASW
jgi:hypothetical protein